MRRGFEMRLLFEEKGKAEIKEHSLGVLPISKIEETIALLFSIGEVMNDEGDWYTVESVAFIAEEDSHVAVICHSDGNGGEGVSKEGAMLGSESEKAKDSGPDIADLLHRPEGMRLN